LSSSRAVSPRRRPPLPRAPECPPMFFSVRTRIVAAINAALLGWRGWGFVTLRWVPRRAPRLCHVFPDT
jgi:hypothetical protein